MIFDYDFIFGVFNVDELNTPVLVIYSERVKKNILIAKKIIGENILRPHIKQQNVKKLFLCY